MLLFNLKGLWVLNIVDMFQYILCYCSTMSMKRTENMQLGFNTSYVTVQHVCRGFRRGCQQKFQYILCYCSTDKRLNSTFISLQFQYILCYCSTKSKRTWQRPLVSFQYILCYCSTLNPFSRCIIYRGFNTSYVTVQPPSSYE